MNTVPIKLDTFQLRWYQEPVFNAIEKEGYRKVLYVAPRRCGKDVLAFNLAWRQCVKRTCLVFYVLKTYGQGKKVIFNAISNDGLRFLDFIPQELIEQINQSEMLIRFKNGSLLQIVGGDTFKDTIVGTNPYAVILSEFATLSPDTYNYIRPILAANGGWILAVSTPRGKNHMYTLHMQIDNIPSFKDWKVVYQKTSEIKHIPEEILAQERAQLDPGMYMQEYECSYERGISGSYYQECLDRLHDAGQITSVPHDPSLLTHVAMDIGINDPTTLIWFQVVGDGQVIRIIDCYSNTNLGIDHYAKILQDKPYRYGSYYAPHDIKVREWGSGAVTRFEKARQLGITFTLIDQVPLADGIENVWTHFNKFWIDKTKCKTLIDALENYRRQWNEQLQEYTDKPIHNWASHYADALRYLCLALHKTKKQKDGSEYTRARQEYLYGASQNLPPVFRNDNYSQWIR